MTNFFLKFPTVQLKWVVEPSDVEVGVGRQLHVDCSADSLPKPNIEWTKIGQDRRDLIGGELRFQSVSQQDAGYYECRARNGLEEDLVSRIKLSVLGK